MSQDDIECESFTVISTDFFLYMKTNITASIFRQLCLWNYTQIMDYLDDNLFEELHIINEMKCFDRIDISKRIDPYEGNRSRECVTCHY